MAQDDAVIQTKVLEFFYGLNAIPRKSEHEEAVSDYLLSIVRSMNLVVVQDEWGNIIAEKPATPGYEKTPVTILQAHMDMVCVGAEGFQYDPLVDPIKTKIVDNFLVAEGTSLGADDGIGVAAILYLLQAEFSHGPLKAIFTVDEESGMKGAVNLAPEYLDARYLINCDSEDFNAVTVSSAGSITLNFSKQVKWHQADSKQVAIDISVQGLLGGHSGMEIHCGRANAIRIIALLLDRLSANGIAFSIADLQGGKARNSIPGVAKTTITVAETAMNEVTKIIEEMQDYLKKVYGNVDKDGNISWSQANMPEKVMDENEQQALIDLLCMLHTGVYAMVPQGNMVESSANLGLLYINDETVYFQFFPRSSVNEVIDDFQRLAEKYAKLFGYNLEVGSKSSGWPQNIESPLTKMVQHSFAEITGRHVKTESIHAGLECSWFYRKNPKLDMVSIGPTITDIHSPKETLHLNTLVPHVKLIQSVLRKLLK